MKSLIKKLLYDKEMSKAVSKKSLNTNHLYGLLYAGKITLQEYLHLVRDHYRHHNLGM